MSGNNGIVFLRWALPKLGYRWEGYRKPRNQVLKRIRERMYRLGLNGGYSAYRNYLEENPEEWQYLDRLLDVTISKFFRDRKVWEFMRDKLLPQLFKKLNSRKISAWSAGCCNGEEAYSLAIISRQAAEISEGSKPVEILGSDRNPDVLQRARSGLYPASALKELKKDERNAFFNEVEKSGEEEHQIIKPIQRNVTFEQRDIASSLPDQIFDLILCRNLVFTYFTKKRQQAFLDRLRPHLSGHGYLIIGANENLPDVPWLRAFSNTHRIFAKI